MAYRNRHSGFGLIEVLVALVITLVSVLGAVALSVKTTQQEAESYQRVQALALLAEMVDRMSANRQAALCYSNGANGLTLGATGTTNAHVCTTTIASSSTVQQQARAVGDLTEWDNHLQGALEKTGSSTVQANVGAVIGARGCVVLIDPTNNIYRVTVAWQGLGPTTAPNGPCGQGQYGAENLRRTVNAIIHL
jgi:type IV pilus assembly protein PilV